MLWNLFQWPLEQGCDHVIERLVSWLCCACSFGSHPYASVKCKAVHFTINRDAREDWSRAYFATQKLLPLWSEELIYTRLVADLASLSSVGRAPGCSWKNPNVSADTRVSPVQVWERGPITIVRFLILIQRFCCHHQRHTT